MTKGSFLGFSACHAMHSAQRAEETSESALFMMPGLFYVLRDVLLRLMSTLP